MKLWLLTMATSDFIAPAAVYAGHPRTRDPCPVCGRASPSERTPLTIEWVASRGDDRDFVWPGAGETTALSERAARVLSDFEGWKPGPVNVVRGSAPPLVELRVTKYVHADRHQSTITLEARCDACGREVWRVDGVEHNEQGRRVPRRRRMGVFVSGNDIDGYDLFRIQELPAWIIVTDRVKQAIENHELTNVDFSEVGEVIDQQRVIHG